MMVLDGAFIIELLLKNFLDESVDDLMFGKPHLIAKIWPDLCMLENQVPFLVLEELFDTKKITRLFDAEGTSILKLALYFFNPILSAEGMENLLGSIENFVDLFKKVYEVDLPLDSHVGKKSKHEVIPSLTLLCKVGVKIEAGLAKIRFDIRFN
ncbi:hypothetical protein Pyn_20956 [Prunus yedoensis var. nudiflora]|uniref:Uncharacterized protein n=1 Tax=Prunus yedoensis var. nudiflora TaxID=2094558 RepID=A0A314UF58_PRUYE|nr:hypothetical protein Pyn_20956 [Prunus yedoensis var. nudiflora]